MKILLILFAIGAIIILAISFVLRSIRRFLGLSPRSTRMHFSTNFGWKKKEARQSGNTQVLFDNQETVVLSGESDSSPGKQVREVRDASFTDKSCAD